MATEAEVLEKVGSYCTEKQYTLNDDFRSQFSEKFAKVNTDADINDENVLNSIKFNLDTAFSAASKELKVKDETWKTEKAEYEKQIEALKKKQESASQTVSKKEDSALKLPEEVVEQLKELNQYKDKKQKQEKRAEVLGIAKQSVREDLRGKLEDLLDIMQIDYSKDEKELAKQLNDSFVKMYKDQIGNGKPQSPENKSKMYESILASVPKVKV